MTDDDRFSRLHPSELLVALASLERRYREALEPYEETPADELRLVRTSTGPILDELATVTAALDAAAEAVVAAATDTFPDVPASVLGLAPVEPVSATRSLAEHLDELASAAHRVHDELEGVPRTHWGRTARAAGIGGHATIEQIGQQAARTAVGALARIDAAS